MGNDRNIFHLSNRFLLIFFFLALLFVLFHSLFALTLRFERRPNDDYGTCDDRRCKIFHIYSQVDE